MEHYAPVGTGSDFTLTESGLSIYGALEPYKPLVNIYEGFHYAKATTHEGVLNFLSGADVAEGDDTTPRTTLEHYIGNELGMRTLALGAVAHREWGLDANAKAMWDGEAVVPQKNPLVAYDEVFSGLQPTAPEATADSELRDALLTLTEEDITALSTEVSAFSSEQSKLQTHLESIQALRDGGGGEISCTEAPALDAVEAVRTASQGQGDAWFLKEENFPTILAAQLQLAAAAMVCNARPVTAIQSLYTTAELSFGFIDPIASEGHHNGLSHDFSGFSSGEPNMNLREGFATAQKWFIDQLVSQALSRLDVPDPADPDHTVLENSIVLICSEIGDGALHANGTVDLNSSDYLRPYHSYLPLFTVGGGGGSLITGQRLNYHDLEADPGASDRPATELWLTLAKAMGVQTNEFGGSTQIVKEALV